MNSLKLTGAMAALCVVLSGCNTMSQTSYENMQEALKGASFRQQVTKQCTSEMSAKGKTHREGLASVMGVSLRQMPSVFCSRVVNAMANGRLNYADYVASKNKGNASKVIKVIQGR
ncbi:hypothetical protein G6N74_15430 [Mesorhizobium sp. CGMCC 1.15528]|uniref:Lipoprotein n=1 Tax=Mesorhizobium zhangyense TaxID=1776730 RepID=A0A7C9R817_9HYPH|nr:hypothetical protein [Mesorhizobium zhangyense]NGN42460.1 hypothetical protein [Mesorhizobium zhangyense]